jgi:PAS domain S-box-containing protein
MTEGKSELFGGSPVRSSAFTLQLRYGVVLLSVALAWGTNLLLHAYLAPTPTPVFFAAVMVSAWYGGLESGLLAMVLSTLVINYFYIEPLYSLNTSNFGELVRLSVFVMTALLINLLSQTPRSPQWRTATIQALPASETIEREQALNAEVQAAKAQLETVLATLDDQFLVLDREWRYVYVSDRVVEIVGRPREELLGQCIWELFPDIIGSQFDTEVHRAVAEQQIVLFEYFYAAWQRWFENRVYPSATGVSILVVDITDRKQTEAALRQSEERLRVALKNSPITVFNQDQNLRHTWVYNPTVDLDPSEILGKQDRDFLSEEDATVLTQIKRHVLETGRGAREEVKFTLQGQVFYYDLTVEPLLDANGEIIGVTCASVDITERKQMELALRQSESALNALIASSPIGIAFVDRDFRYIHANEALAETNGIPLSEHLGRTVEEVLPEWAPVITPVLQQVMDTKEPLLNQEVVGATHPSDVVRYALVNYFPVCLPDGQVLGVGATAVDISDRRRMEESLRQSEERYRAIYDQVLVGISQADLTGKIISANERFCEIVGRSQEELLTLRMQDITHPDDLPPNLVLFQTMVENGTSFEIEKRYIRPDGSQVWVRNYVSLIRDGDGQPKRGVAVTEDITERQRAENALRDSEERLRLALIAANQGLYDLNVQTGDAIVSPAYAEMLGYDPDEFQETNANWRDRLHPDDVGVVYQAYEDYIAGALETYRVEFRQRTKSGDWKWILSIGKIVAWDSDGQPLRMLGTHTDITDRKQAETEREQLLEREKIAREQAETVNRIKDEFLAVLSHELRSPLNPILGWSRLLQTQKLDEQKIQQALATIERNARLQTQLIEDLLDVSRILRGKLVLNVAPVSLTSTIEAALETVRLAAEAKGIEIQRVLNFNVDQVMGDAARLQQVIWNLLSNAVKFTPSGGKVEIRLEQVNTHAQIQVRDTGKGINPNFLPYVFDYFRQEDGTTTRKFGGLGLGLAIVRHITELHGGTVSAESPGEGLGAIFTVQLPLMPITISVEEKDESSTIANLAGLRVLAVDDDADIRAFMQFVLEQAGAEVRVVASASELLQQLEAFSPEVLISDVGMPDFDGYMLMRKVRNLSLKRGMIPAIALTAYASELDQQQAIAAGFQMHLAKPVEPEKLISAIVTLLNENGVNEC